MPNINYDDNGNILNLQRNGKIGANSFGLMDNLTYAYSGNRLNSVLDAVGTNNEVDFVPRGNNAYTYYSNGALKSDANEQISNIVYNTYVNQPTEVILTDGRKIKHYYDGSGALFKTEYFNASGAIFETYQYIGGIIYKNGAFFQIGIPDGRVIFSNGNWQYEFDYKDHLGNTRVSFKAEGNTLVQTAKTDFDPWGVILKSSQGNAFANRFELQEKERDLTFGLNWVNFGARRINPTIGRMDNVDGMANKFASHSLYNYALNRPLNIIDPDGNESRDIWGNTTFNGFVGDDGSGNFVGTTSDGDDKEKGKKKEEDKPGVKTEANLYAGAVVGAEVSAFDIKFMAMVNAGSVKITRNNDEFKLERSIGLGLELFGFGIEFEMTKDLIQKKTGSTTFEFSTPIGSDEQTTTWSTKTLKDIQTVNTTKIGYSGARLGAGFLIKGSASFNYTGRSNQYLLKSDPKVSKSDATSVVNKKQFKLK